MNKEMSGVHICGRKVATVREIETNTFRVSNYGNAISFCSTSIVNELVAFTTDSVCLEILKESNGDSVMKKLERLADRARSGPTQPLRTHPVPHCLLLMG